MYACQTHQTCPYILIPGLGQVQVVNRSTCTSKFLLDQLQGCLVCVGMSDFHNKSVSDFRWPSGLTSTSAIILYTHVHVVISTLYRYFKFSLRFLSLPLSPLPSLLPFPPSSILFSLLLTPPPPLSPRPLSPPSLPSSQKIQLRQSYNWLSPSCLLVTLLRRSLEHHCGRCAMGGCSCVAM